ncbi:aminoglycoside adenylyltransferase domain-containing protein [Anaerocolumna xylanovorans]|uniref:Streptomycin 3-adenylyltransferase n=1 Tax=Anaerocolumna xylanovorans DSM 12503 TaxID=1121345 RepID=A0A1M7YKL4_9FIRM|nr:aminoglycoside adenylyltransferase domain-containing protein [Anaerocolumna xylanovorans]SHO53122.1 streptomycin 3-adenylyltransferase [Anaerocolumna xylanovorans DSM 12503]
MVIKMKIQEILNRLVECSRRILKDNLVGVYLHGSIAMGCFNPGKSDIDILLVTEKEAIDQQKRDLMDSIIVLNETAPAKGIEMSLVRSEYCKNFIYPTPFDLHFSVTHLNWYKNNPDEYIEKMNGTDPDLAAHFVIIKNRGIVLYGKEIKDLFGEIPSDAYLESIKNDVSEAEKDISDNPVYTILNLCRVLAYVQDKLVLSKKEGGEWGIKNIDKGFGPLIQEAMECYGTDKTMVLDDSLAFQYCAYMKRKIGL